MFSCLQVRPKHDSCFLEQNVHWGCLPPFPSNQLRSHFCVDWDDTGLIYNQDTIVLGNTHGRQSWGGWGDISPPLILGRGGWSMLSSPPGNEWSSGISYLNCLIYQHGKVRLQLFFDGLSLIFIIQLFKFIVNHWNKHNCFPNCSHI